MQQLRSNGGGSIGGVSSSRGGGGSSGSYSIGDIGHVRSGHFSSSSHEGKTNIVETHHFHNGHEISITERLKMGDDSKTLNYENEIVGPGGKTHRQEITFEVE